MHHISTCLTTDNCCSCNISCTSYALGPLVHQHLSGRSQSTCTGLNLHKNTTIYVCSIQSIILYDSDRYQWHHALYGPKSTISETGRQKSIMHKVNVLSKPGLIHTSHAQHCATHTYYHSITCKLKLTDSYTQPKADSRTPLS